jgi:ferritin-like metal-binding protein YciE
VKTDTLRELYIKELQDLYDAENQIIEALPKMIKAASASSLTSALERHLETTKAQAVQLEELFARLDEEAEAKKCKGMAGLLKEGEEVLEEDMDPEVRDAAIIAATQRVEHYEIAGYGCVKTYAGLLGDDEAARMLEEILGQEKEADARLTAIAEHINVEALEGDERPGGKGMKKSARSSPGQSSRDQRSARSREES